MDRQTQWYPRFVDLFIDYQGNKFVCKFIVLNFRILPIAFNFAVPQKYFVRRSMVFSNSLTYYNEYQGYPLEYLLMWVVSAGVGDHPCLDPCFLTFITIIRIECLYVFVYLPFYSAYNFFVMAGLIEKILFILFSIYNIV